VRIRDTLLPIVWRATRNKTVIRRVPTIKMVSVIGTGILVVARIFQYSDVAGV
jgi:hypothetical protein